jgi:hypothetical protein
MQATLIGFLVVAVSTVLAVAGMFFVRSKVNLKTLQSYHEVAGYLLGVIGTLYAVLLGFVTVEAMNNVQDARVTVEQEANCLANVFLLSDGMGKDTRLLVQRTCRRYSDRVIDEEWKAMEKGQFSLGAYTEIAVLWATVTRFKPTDQTEANLHQEMLSQISDLANSRRLRLIQGTHGISPVLWVVLIIGGVFTVIFTYFFGVEDLRIQAFMTVMVAMILSLNMFLISIFGYPYSGELAVRPSAFMLDRMIFQHHDEFIPPVK